MSNVIRVIAPQYAGNNALMDKDPSHYSLFSDQDNVLIKEKARGSGTGSSTIAHNLGYIPFYMVFSEVSAGRYRLTSDATLNNPGRASADITNLYITPISGGDYKYYIFYDNFT